MASVQDWIEKYEQDIQAAKDNTIENKKLKECHLASESIIKAILTKQGVDFDKTHNTSRLVEDIQRFPSEKKKLLSYLNSVYKRRYPDDLGYKQTYTAEQAIEEVKDLKDWADNNYLYD